MHVTDICVLWPQRALLQISSRLRLHALYTGRSSLGDGYRTRFARAHRAYIAYIVRLFGIPQPHAPVGLPFLLGTQLLSHHWIHPALPCRVAVYFVATWVQLA